MDSVSSESQRVPSVKTTTIKIVFFVLLLFVVAVGSFWLINDALRQGDKLDQKKLLLKQAISIAELTLKNTNRTEYKDKAIDRIVCKEDMPLFVSNMLTGIKTCNELELLSFEVMPTLPMQVPAPSTKQTIANNATGGDVLLLVAPVNIVMKGTYGKIIPTLKAIQDMYYLTEIESLALEGKELIHEKRLLSATITMKVFVRNGT